MNTVKLNWESASAHLLTSLKEVWSDDGFSNVTLAFEDESFFQTNRTLLAAVSPVMRQFLKMNTAPNCQILMFGLESSMVRALLDFIFTEEICIEQDKLERFFATASKLKVDGFMESAGLAEQNQMKVNDTPQEDIPHDFKVEESKPELLSTLDEINSSDIFPFENPCTLKELPRQVVGEAPNEGENFAMQKIAGSIERKTTRLEMMDEEAVNENKGFSCFHCRAMEIVDHDKFQTMDDLHQHEKEVHMKDKSALYNCEQCGKEFYKLVYFNQHKRKEHPENPTVGKVCCDVCGRSFKTKASMEKHRDYSHPVPGKVFNCRMPNCKKVSLTKNASSVHYYQGHSEKQRKEFEGKL